MRIEWPRSKWRMMKTFGGLVRFSDSPSARSVDGNMEKEHITLANNPPATAHSKSLCERDSAHTARASLKRFASRKMLFFMTCTAVAHAISARPATSSRPLPVILSRRASVAMNEEELDWREMRARLVAQEQESGTPAASNGSYAYETPLIEQGSILMGGTKQVFGFALRQQFFHKSVMLLLQHDETFTKRIILNRPSAIEQDGWRLWCGHGQVAEGGFFLGADKARGQLEINALHALEGFLVDQVRIATDERGLRLMATGGD